MGLFGIGGKKVNHCIWCGREITEKNLKELHYCKDGFVCHSCILNEQLPADYQPNHLTSDELKKYGARVRQGNDLKMPFNYNEQLGVSYLGGLPNVIPFCFVGLYYEERELVISVHAQVAKKLEEQCFRIPYDRIRSIDLAEQTVEGKFTYVIAIAYTNQQGQLQNLTFGGGNDKTPPEHVKSCRGFVDTFYKHFNQNQEYQRDLVNETNAEDDIVL